MRFGRTLRASVYKPWQSHYLDYGKLKQLLREDELDDDDPSSSLDDRSRKWTDEDESAFVEELLNVQLEKVNTFHAETFEQLRERTSECETKLEGLARAGGTKEGHDEKGEHRETLRYVEEELDSITKEINELEKYSRINYTGFLKAAKKHDRRRGSQYKVRPLLQVRLAALPFNSEDFSPLLRRLSAMYSFTRQRTDGDLERTMSGSDSKVGGDTYKTHKFWVHPENILEVKTYILRRLPVLVYNPQTSRVVEGSQIDPTITSLYFDNEQFSLYTRKVDRMPEAASLRLRWYGHLRDRPEILFERKTIHEENDSSEIRFPIKEKYIQSFMAGEYKMEKSLQKLHDRSGQASDAISQFETSVNEIQEFIGDNQLQPVMRANYTRTAFQIPGDNRVRISLDTNLALIREDALDQDRPCRPADDWHRNDIDKICMAYPFSDIRKGEIARFPFAVLEIKVRDGAAKRKIDWLNDLMSSHLVKEAPRFSKFVHGVAQLFEDHVNSFPFWLSDLETDIRRNPEDAFREEQEKKATQAEDDMRVGSMLGSKSVASFKAAVGSPIGKPSAVPADQMSKDGVDEVAEEHDSDDEPEEHPAVAATTTSGFSSFLPSFSNSKYARAHRRDSVRLPPGVREPGRLIKDSGEVHVEPKVWLANERTFIKWQHIAVLLAVLSLTLYNAAGESNNMARALAIVYLLIAAFTGLWGLGIYHVRNRMIKARSGKDFDNVVGPLFVCGSLVVALCINFGLRVGGKGH